MSRFDFSKNFFMETPFGDVDLPLSLAIALVSLVPPTALVAQQKFIAVGRVAILHPALRD